MIPAKVNALFLAFVLALTPSTGVGAGPSGDAPHKMHLTSGSAAVEGKLLVVRIRFFKDDLEAALAGHTGHTGYLLRTGPDVDADVVAYINAHLTVSVNGAPLVAQLVGSGEDDLEREPVWWYALQFEAQSVLTAFRVRNTLLTEVFEDQRNIVKFIHFPEEKQQTYSFAIGEEEFEVRF